VTIVVKKMEKRGLVKRVRKHNDERVVLVSLTRQGKEAFERWRNERRSALFSFFQIERRRKG